MIDAFEFFVDALPVAKDKDGVELYWRIKGSFSAQQLLDLCDFANRYELNELEILRKLRERDGDNA